MFFMHHCQHPDGTGYAGCTPAGYRLAIAQRLSVGPEEHRRAGLRRRGLPAVINSQFAGCAIQIGQEGAATKAGTLRLDQRQHRLHGNRRIDGTTAPFQNILTRFRRRRIGGNDEGFFLRWCGSCRH